MANDDLTDVERRILAKTPVGDAYWTSDISYDARVTNRAAGRSALDKLLKKGFVEKVVQGAPGKPSSWRRTDAGTAALARKDAAS